MWYRTGTIGLTNGSTAVTGSGTAFIANAAVGEALLAPDGKYYEIAAVVSDTSLTLGSNYLGTTASAQAYAILPSQSFVRDLAAQAAALIQTYADIATGAGAGKFSSGTSALPGIAGSADTDTGINLAGSNVLNLVAGGATRVSVTTAGAAVTGTLSTSGNATLGDSTSADSHTVNGVAAISANSATDALKVTQAGAGNALLIEDIASDTTPFVVTNTGDVVVGHIAGIGMGQFTNVQSHATGGRAGLTAVRWSADTISPRIQLGKSRSATIGAYAAVQSGDDLGGVYFYGDDGTDLVTAGASIIATVDGTPGSNDMPGRLSFNTTSDAGSSPTERMRIDSAGSVAIGSASTSSQKLAVVGFMGASTTGYCTTMWGNYDLDYTSGVGMSISTPMPTNGGTPYTVSSYQYFSAVQGAFNADATVTNQIGFGVPSSLIGATNNYAFLSNIPSGTGRWNFYAAGNAANHFTGVTTHGAAFGYGVTTGVGGTVTQATSKATGVTLNTPTGQITLNAASLAASTTALFTLTNSAIGANDTIICHRKSGGTAGAYQVWVDSVAAGSCVIAVRNTTAGALAEAPLLQYSIIKGAIA